MANLLLKNVLSYSPKLTFSIFNRLNVFSEINGSLKKKLKKSMEFSVTNMNYNYYNDRWMVILLALIEWCKTLINRQR